MTLDESFAKLREVFGDEFTPKGTMTRWEFFDSVVTLCALQTKQIQDMQNQIDRLERDVAALEGRSE